MYPLQAAEHLLVRVVHRNPRLGFRLADLYGPINYRWFQNDRGTGLVGRSVFEQVAGPQDRAAYRASRRRQAARFERRRLLEYLFANGNYHPLFSLIRWKNPEYIQDSDRPVIAVTWHAGPFASLPVGLVYLGRPVTTLLAPEFRMRPLPEVESCYISSSGKGIEAFRQCSAALKQGRTIGMAGDHLCAPDEGTFVQLIGINVYIKRGFAALARRCRARVVPVGIEWSETGELVYTAHPPLPGSLAPCKDPVAFERRLVREYAAVADTGLRRNLREIDGYFLRILAECARKQKRRRRDSTLQAAPLSHPEDLTGMNSGTLA